MMISILNCGDAGERGVRLSDSDTHLLLASPGQLQGSLGRGKQTHLKSLSFTDMFSPQSNTVYA